MVLCVVSGAQVFAALGMFAIPALTTHIKETTGFSSAEMGYIFSLAFAMGGISSVSVGGFIRRYGANRVFQLGQIVLAVGALLVATSATRLTVIGSAMIGFGFGVASPVASIILAQFSRSAYFNLLFSAKQMATPIGAVLAGAVAPALATTFSWPVAFSAIAALAVGSVFVLVPFRRFWDRDAQASAPVSPPWNGFRMIFRDRTLTVLGLTGFFYSVAQLGLAGFLVLFLVEDLSYSAITAGLMLSLVSGAGLVSRPVWGWCADRIGAVSPVLMGIGIVTTASATLVALMTPEWPDTIVYAVFLAFGAAGFGWSGVQIAAVASVAPAERRSETFSGAFGLIFLGALAGPGLASIVFSVFHSYAAVFVALGLAGFTGTVLTAAAWGRAG